MPYPQDHLFPIVGLGLTVDKQTTEKRQYDKRDYGGLRSYVMSANWNQILSNDKSVDIFWHSIKSAQFSDVSWTLPETI